MCFCVRADASTAIGTGHVVRCATLAHLLVAQGHHVDFVCRRLAGDLIASLEAQGFRVGIIEGMAQAAIDERADAQATARLLQGKHYDWLIVDHYGLGAAWEAAMVGFADRIFAIDDMGRAHDCDLLLDQNHGNATHALYPRRVPARCTLLLGADYALLRPEFAELRAVSLARRDGDLARLLVFMGGSDPTNETCKALRGVAMSECVPAAIDVVIGSSNPHRHAVERACAALAGTRLHIQTERMAELMCEADCAIGAAGTTTWERCALGLPALVVALADNQIDIARTIDAAGAHRLLGWGEQLTERDYASALAALDAPALAAMSQAGARLCDGLGTQRVATRLTGARGARASAGSATHG